MGLAVRLYKEAKLRNIALFFKNVDRRQLTDPGEQLQKVLKFRTEIEKSKRYLFKAYGETPEFCEMLEAHLAKWQNDHKGTDGGLALNTKTSADIKVNEQPKSDFSYWYSESRRLCDNDSETPNYGGALYCAEKARSLAVSQLESARAYIMIGVAQFRVRKFADALKAFSDSALQNASSEEGFGVQASALFNKGLTLNRLGREADAIEVYDDLLKRYESSDQESVRDSVIRALLDKGLCLSQQEKYDQEIAAYDRAMSIIKKPGSVSEKESFADALLYKAYALNALNKSSEAIESFSKIIDLFGNESGVELRRSVAWALSGRAEEYLERGESEKASADYKKLIAEYSSAKEADVKKLVAEAKETLGNKSK